MIFTFAPLKSKEGWVSGWYQQFAKLPYGKLYRGFESPFLRCELKAVRKHGFFDFKGDPNRRFERALKIKKVPERSEGGFQLTWLPLYGITEGNSPLWCMRTPRDQNRRFERALKIKKAPERSEGGFQLTWLHLYGITEGNSRVIRCKRVRLTSRALIEK